MKTAAFKLQAVRVKKEKTKGGLRKRIYKNRALILMFLPVAVFFIVFRYLPILGNVIAFKQYNLMLGILDSPWVGLQNFHTLFSNPQTVQIIRNTLVLSVLGTLIGFPFPILVAVLLNEVKGLWFKKSVQTLLYLPHFFSWVIIGGIIVTLFGSQAGIISQFLFRLTGHEFELLYEIGSWMTIFFGSSVWKEAGFGAIIYLAAISSIDPSLYESASIDGAGKLRQIWNVTLPGIMPTAVIMLILSMGRIMDVGFEQIYNLQNAAVSDISRVISTYLYAVGIQGGMYSLTTAMGLFESLVAIIFVIGSNAIARRLGHSLW
ncbi:sugar ABC transporter permease [Paenibacillus sp. YN15]|uniref:ABC transporter permease n=1 Tax=Paenibacillus sp. YN15 TaxID=1742774 RepID=UPI000DCCF6D7|nr:ABC transporter permease subunit [Paenibacillus sp. YN15]RAV06507.1 sugar ABC transporter permease [Paenibacillus sp. YN15]